MNIHPKTSLITQIAHFYRLRYPKVPGEATPERLPHVGRYRHKPPEFTTPTCCGWSVIKTLQMVCFSLVTILRLLY
jgi:hypothetical protein